MKKFVKMFLICISLFVTNISLSSCDMFSQNNKFVINRKEGIDSFIELDKDNLEIIISTNKNAVIYVGSSGCSSCTATKPFFKEVIENDSLIIYYMEYSSFNTVIDNLSDAKGFSKVALTPTLLFVREGYEIERIIANKNFYDVDAIEQMILSRIYANGPYLVNYIYHETLINSASGKEYQSEYYTIDYLSTKTLDQTISKLKSTVYFARSTCSDCQYFEKNFILDYLKDNNKKLYIFDTIEIREDEDLWIAFKENYQFNNYREGRVPSIVVYQENVKTNMVVYVNDQITKNDNNKWVVTDSFYPELIGTEGDSYLEVYEYCASYQSQQIKVFLDQNL